MPTQTTSAPQSTDEKRDLSIKEGAYLMSVSYFWIWRRIGKENGPPFKKRGALYVLPRKEFMAWANQDKIP